MTLPSPQPAGFWRRLAAMFYDGLLLLALYMFSAAILLPFTRGEAITPQDSALLTYVLRALLVAVTVFYFGWSWTRSGQTLGMLAWKIRALRADGARLSWRDVILRLCASLLSWAPAGLGFLWILFDGEKRAWHDRLSRTRLIRS
jgi:uncharacterized RDD family membrane protein YckC